LLGIAESKTVSNWELRDSQGRPKSKPNPVVLAYMLLKLGQHPDFVLVPRADVEFPRRDASRKRKPRNQPGQSKAFFIECKRSAPTGPEPQWEPVGGAGFSTLTGACVAAEAMEKCARLLPLRIALYVNGVFEDVAHGDPDAEPAQEAKPMT
jgi:hypothetical protein